jgi:uncharacterized protein YjbI with pentapeptide repeats
VALIKKKKLRRFKLPEQIDAYNHLHANEIDKFHEAIKDLESVDFSNTSLRGADFRTADLSRVVIQGAYLMGADLRGVDLRHHNLEGTSLHNALISGVYFPNNVAPSEIIMSVEHGTRIRTSGALVPPKE